MNKNCFESTVPSLPDQVPCRRRAPRVLLALAATEAAIASGVVHGVTLAKMIGLFHIPVCYVFVQRIVERGGKPNALVAAAAAPEKGGAH